MEIDSPLPTAKNFDSFLTSERLRPLQMVHFALGMGVIFFVGIVVFLCLSEFVSNNNEWNLKFQIKNFSNTPAGVPFYSLITGGVAYAQPPAIF